MPICHLLSLVTFVSLQMRRHHVAMNCVPFDVIMPIEVIQTPISGSLSSDKLYWPFTNDGVFNVKSGYQRVRELNAQINLGPSSSNSIDYEFWKNLWHIPIPEKIKHFLWKCCHNILPIRANLARKKIARSDSCPICFANGRSLFGLG